MIWFLDEPFSALDPLIRRQMQDEFLRLQRLLHKTIVFITHDFLEAIRLGDRIAIMNEGEIVQIGTPAEVILNPADDYVAEFTKDVPRARVLTVRAIMEPLAGELDPGTAVPEDMTLDDLLPRIVGQTEPLGVKDGDGRLIGQVSRDVLVRALASEKETVGS